MAPVRHGVAASLITLEQVGGLIGDCIVTGHACAALSFVRQEDVTAGRIEGGHVGHGGVIAETRYPNGGLRGIGLDLAQAGQVGRGHAGRHLPGVVELVDVVGHLGNRGALNEGVEEHVRSGGGRLAARQDQTRD